MTASPVKRSAQSRVTLARLGYLTVVIAGFVAAVSMGAGQLVAGSWSALVTIVFALGLAIRYWWVILLLAWPFTLPRIVLLLAMWGGVGVVAANTGDVRAWAWSLVAVFLIGTATELYNHATRQWVVGIPALERSLRADHVRGASSAALAAAATVAILVTAPRYTTAFVAGLVVIDWIRLAEMIRRHRRFLEAAA
jgi:hypothetical protein